MIQCLGYPSSLISVEKRVSGLDHVQMEGGEGSTRKRFDLLCFSQTLQPLLLIECKAVPLRHAMFGQLIGYNLFAKAPFLGLVNQDRQIFSWKDLHSGEQHYQDHFPSFQVLTCQTDLLQAKV